MKHFFPQINLADLLSFNYIHNSLNLQQSAISFIQFAHINLPDLLLFAPFSLQVFLIRTFLLSVILISNHKPLLFYTIPLNKIYNINDRKKLSKAIVISQRLPGNFNDLFSELSKIWLQKETTSRLQNLIYGKLPKDFCNNNVDFVCR